MKARPTQSRGGVKGQLPLAGSRDSVPCGVWGNAPTVPRATSISNALNKGADSEASLPVTLRVRRRALKLRFPQDSVKNRKKAGVWRNSSPCTRFVYINNYFLFPPNSPVIPPRIPRVTCRVTSRVAVLIAVFCTRPSNESFFRARAARSSRSSSACFRRSSA